jgi:hypothetical protein
MYKNSVSTQNKTQSIFIPKISWFVLFNEIITGNSDYETHKYSKWAKCTFIDVKADGTYSYY